MSLVVADDAPLDRLAAAVDAVSPAPPQLDMVKFAASVCGMQPKQPYQMTRREFQDSERFDGMA